MVHSRMCGAQTTIDVLARARLDAEVIDRALISLGPVLRSPGRLSGCGRRPGNPAGPPTSARGSHARHPGVQHDIVARTRTAIRPQGAHIARLKLVAGAGGDGTDTRSGKQHAPRAHGSRNAADVLSWRSPRVAGAEAGWA